MYKLCIQICQFYCVSILGGFCFVVFLVLHYCAWKLFKSAANIRVELSAGCLLRNSHMCQINTSVRRPLRTVDSTLSIC